MGNSCKDMDDGQLAENQDALNGQAFLSLLIVLHDTDITIIYAQGFFMKAALIFGLVLIFAFPCFAANVPVQEAEQPGKPVQDAPKTITDRSTLISVILDGTDSLGARLATRLKERFNQSSLFRLNPDEDKDRPELKMLLNTTPEFQSRPGVGSVFGICWVFSQGKGYLGYLLAREVGTVNAEDMDALVDKLVERTDGIAAKYSNLWK